MKLPRRAPPLDPKHVADGLRHMAKPEYRAFIHRANSEYFHWDELRARPRPAGLSLESAWAAVKMARLTERRTLPLCDPKGRPFGYWLPPKALATLHEVDRWGGSTVAFDAGAVVSLEAMREQVIVSSLMEEAIATSQIEGAATTRRVAKELLRTNRRARDRSEQMIVNSYETMQFLRAEKAAALSLDMLFEIQARMTRDTLDDATGAGRLRTEKDEIAIVDVRDGSVLFTPPPAKVLKARLEKLIAFANAEAPAEEFIHPLVKAAVLHFWLAYEHPFVDGNGRTARALFYWFMLKSGYWLFEFLTVSRAIMSSRAGYYRAFLYSEHDDEDLTYSLLFQLEATRRAIGESPRASPEEAGGAACAREDASRRPRPQPSTAVAGRPCPAPPRRDRHVPVAPALAGDHAGHCEIGPARSRRQGAARRDAPGQAASVLRRRGSGREARSPSSFVIVAELLPLAHLKRMQRPPEYPARYSGKLRFVVTELPPARALE